MADTEQRDTPERAEGPPAGVRGMAIVRWALIFVMGCVAVASIVYSFELLSPSAAPSADVRYYCPMHPQIVQDHPGDCPICNMTLVPMPSPGAPRADKHGDVPGLTPIELRPERVQRIGMRTAVASERELSPSLRAVAVVSADEARVARVHARFSGWVERLLVKTTGQQVSAGQVLASIYNTALLPAQQELLAALRWQSGPDLAPARATPGVELAEDARARLELLGMSPRQIQRLVETGAPTRTLDVTSPITGTVTQKSAVQGSYLEPGTELFEITDLSRIWVVGEVYAAESSRLAVGQSARVEVGALPGVEGRITFINPTLNATTRALGFRVELDNPKRELRPGMFADVVVQLGSRRGLVIPAEALVDTGEQQYVFLARDGGRFEPRRVRAGARVLGDVEILDGLAAGDVVVTTASFLIDSESRLRAAIEGLGAVTPSP